MLDLEQRPSPCVPGGMSAFSVKTGKYLLILSFSQFDPNQTFMCLPVRLGERHNEQHHRRTGMGRPGERSGDQDA
jgi:hypothetical protein